MKRMVKASDDMSGGTRVYDLVQYCWDKGISGDSALNLICRQLEKEFVTYDRHAVESKMYAYFDEISDENDFEEDEEW